MNKPIYTVNSIDLPEFAKIEHTVLADTPVCKKCNKKHQHRVLPC